MTGPYRDLVAPLLFRLDAETVHDAVLAGARGASAGLRAAAALGLPFARSVPGRPPLRRLGRTFPNRVGLAAGLDKNGVAPHFWAALGFGFAEIGTVTWEPQSGNDRPRIFRLPEDGALINRMGFPGQGAEKVARRLEHMLRTPLGIPLAINVGVSRSVVGDAVAEARDQARTARLLGPHADFVVVNVSSPNTPGLRDQQVPERITRLVEGVGSALAGLGLGLTTPEVLVKLSPDLDDTGLCAVAQAARSAGAAGFVAVNTTLARDGLRSSVQGESGGLSGRPLHGRAREVIALLRATLGPEPVLVGLGGVHDGRSARALLDAGADLIEVFTGLIYEGPGFARRLVREIGGAGWSGQGEVEGTLG